MTEAQTKAKRIVTALMAEGYVRCDTQEDARKVEAVVERALTGNVDPVFDSILASIFSGNMGRVDA